MGRYVLREFSENRLQDVRHAWRGLAGDDEFEIELATVFDWCEAHISYAAGNSQAWELYNTDSDRCDAIIELIDSPTASLSKLLKLFLSPELWDGSRYEQIVSTFVDAFVAVIQKGAHGGAKDVKLYGRNDLMLSILRTIHAKWPEGITQSKASFKGRWLTITMNV